MKLSKTGKNGWHHRNGVKVNNSKQEGFVYSIPHNDGESTDKFVEDRKKDFKRLYKVFPSVEKARNISEEIAAVIDKTIRNKRTEIWTGKNDYSEMACRFRNLLQRESMFRQPVEVKTAEYMVYGLLRSSLRSEKTEKDLIDFLCHVNDKSSSAGAIFMQELTRDYMGEKINYKSIINQNLVIQPVKTESLKDNIDQEDVLLTVSERKNPEDSAKNYKSIENKALRSFLLEYASLDDNKRKDLRKKLRRIVVLYFYGKSEADGLGENFDEWNDHESRRACEEKFIEFDESTKDNFRSKTSKLIRNANITAYRTSKEIIENNHDGLYFANPDYNFLWLRHLSREVERLTSNINADKTYKLNKGYLSEKSWKGIINYLSIKYIAIGKSVFNFASSGVDSDGSDIQIGEVNREFQNGISSFEYERIKAEETLQRESAVKVAFAARHLASATMNLTPEDSDMLLFDKDKMSQNLKDTGRVLADVLQFFGGQSVWKDYIIKETEKYSSEEEFGTDLLYNLKKCVYALRNDSFHFKTLNNKADWDTDLVAGLFEKDCENMVGLDKDKFYDNNLYKFFKQEDLKKVLDKLYDKIHDRASQIPAFNTVFVRNNFSRFLLSKGITRSFASEEQGRQFASAVYYLFKEIYYNDFIQSGNAKTLFLNYVNSIKIEKAINRYGKEETKRECKPAEDFKTYITLCRNMSFSEICQAVMTEYNQQNNQSRKKKSAFDTAKNKDKFRHYVDILHEGIREAFAAYIGLNDQKNYDGIYGFVKSFNSSDVFTVEKDKFIEGYRSERFQNLISKVRQNPELQKWYIVARLLNPKQVNELSGSIRSYKQYIEDVCRRSIAEKCPVRKNDGKEVSKASFDNDVKELMSIDYMGVVAILEICIRLNGRFSTVCDDYFKDGADGYAEYLEQYLDYQDEKTKDAGVSPSTMLSMFSEEVSADNTDKNQGIIYHDGTNPIMNRNILLSKLYGGANSVIHSVKKVDNRLIADFIKSGKLIQEYNKRGYCINEEEQKNLKRYQALKNRVEFRDIVEYGEILDELQGQLINWSYLRERDLMYFQLGFHYTSLHNSERKFEGYRYITKEDGSVIENAVLHQILSLYINGIPFYYSYADVEGRDRFICCALKKKEPVDGTSNKFEDTGTKMRYVGYYCKEGDNYLGEGIYLAGLELFENIAEHDNIIKLRNYIDHFHYYIEDDRSMLDVYSEVFDRYFSYDIKYQKNVVNMLYNVLLSHFAKAGFEFGEGIKQIGSSKKNEMPLTKKMARILLKSLESDDFTYKIGNTSEAKNQETVVLPARDDLFLDALGKVLNWDGSITDENALQKTEIITGRSGNYLKKSRNSDKKNDGNKRSDIKKSFNKDKNIPEKKEALTSTPFANLFNNLHMDFD